MDDSNKKDFAILFYGTGELYDKAISEDLLRLYFDALKNNSIEDVKDGVSKHVLDPKHGTFFPKPADIVRHIQSNDQCVEDRAKLAWIQILGEVRRTGSYGNLEIEDKQAIAALRAICSWKELCLTDQDKMQWMEKRFIDTYETYDKTPLDLLPNKLPGRIYLDKHKTEQLEHKGRDKVFAKLLDQVNPNKGK